MKPKTIKTKMEFVNDKRPVDKSKDVVPLKRGIYKPVPVSPATPKPAPAAKNPKVKKQVRKPVQFSSQKKAEKHMKQTVKAKQKRGPGAGIKKGFNR
jgi:hypothetical protein